MLYSVTITVTDSCIYSQTMRKVQNVNTVSEKPARPCQLSSNSAFRGTVFDTAPGFKLGCEHLIIYNMDDTIIGCIIYNPVDYTY